jgi:nitroreductase
MELIEAMRTTGTCRRFKPDAVPDDSLYRAFEAARFAPQGGNRQPVSWVVVRDPERKRRLGEWYLPLWRDYLRDNGAPLDNDEMPPALQAADEFARAFGEHPALVVACADLDALYLTDAGLGRIGIVGGASIYPAVQNFCLALRDAGIASALTTMLGPREPEIKALLEVPDELAIACCVVVGYPERAFPTKLRRAPVEERVFVDSYGMRLEPPQSR